MLTSVLASDEEDTSLVKVGQGAPEFQAVTLDGQSFDLNRARGKVVLVTFFQVWCESCVVGMPHLQHQVWERFKGANFVMLAVGREESDAAMRAFQKRTGYNFPMAGDPGRKIYSKYAREGIPRDFVIDANGRVVFESSGYYDADFAALTKAIEQAQR